MTGNIVLDVIIGALTLFGLTIIVADEYYYYKDKRRWRKK